MKQQAPLFPLACCMMAGIALSNRLDDWTIGLWMLAAAVTVTTLLYRWPRVQTAGIWLCALLLGLTLGARRLRVLDTPWPEAAVSQEVVVVEEPIEKERWRVLHVKTTDGRQKVRLHIERDDASEQIGIGSTLQVRAYINKVREWRRDSVRRGQRHHFSYRRYMQCHGFTGEGFVRSYQWKPATGEGRGGLSALERVRLRFLCWRHELLERYRQWGIGDGAYGVLAAMTLGEKSHIDKETRDVYRDVGASHVLALSGLHLMIIYGVITLLVSWRHTQMLSQVLIVLAIWAFALLTGLSPSVTRAAAMISIYALLSLGYREKMSLNTLALVAIVMLAVNPLALYDFGFQLSFMAVLAIVLIHPLLYDIVPEPFRRAHRLLEWFWGLTCVSLAAQIGTAPLVAYYFGYFPTMFLPTNYVVIPLATVSLYLTPVLLAVSWWPWGAGVVATVLSALVGAMNRLLGLIASLPYCTIDGISLSAAQVFLMYVIIGCGLLAVSLLRPATRRNG